MMCPFLSPMLLHGSAWHWVTHGPWVQLSVLKHLKQSKGRAKGVRKARLQSPAADGANTGSQLLPLSWCPGKNSPFS